MPATAAAKQIDLIENARSRGGEEDFSAAVRTFQDLSGFGE
jgi:hypothetical protein